MFENDLVLADTLHICDRDQSSSFNFYYLRYILVFLN